MIRSDVEYILIALSFKLSNQEKKKKSGFDKMGFLMYKSKNRVKGSLIWHLKLSYMKEKNLNPYSVPSLLSFWISFGRLVPALLRNSANSFRLPQGHRLWCKVGKLPGEFFSYSYSRLGNCPILLYLFQFLSFQKNQNSTISEHFGK